MGFHGDLLNNLGFKRQADLAGRNGQLGDEPVVKALTRSDSAALLIQGREAGLGSDDRVRPETSLVLTFEVS